MLRHMTVLFVLILANTECWAVQPYTPVQPDPVLESWRWKSYEVPDMGEVNCIVGDTNGGIWVGSSYGVSHYDGFKWITFKEGFVLSLCVTRGGDLYAGFSRRVCRFSDGEWIEVFSGRIPWDFWDLEPADDGGIWAGTLWGALHIGKHGPTLYTTEHIRSELQGMYPDLHFSVVPGTAATHRVWRNSKHSGFVALQSRSLERVVTDVLPGSPADREGVELGDMVLQQDYKDRDSVLVLTVKRWISRESADTIMVVMAPENLEGVTETLSVNDIYGDRKGTLWFGLLGGDLLQYDKNKNDAWTKVMDSEDFNYSSASITICTAKDQNGTVWVASASASSELRRFNGQDWAKVTLGSTGSSQYHSFIKETQDGSLWLGGKSGRLYRYSEGNWTNYHTSDLPITKNAIRGFFESSDGAIWLGVGPEVWRFDYGSPRWITFENLTFQVETQDETQDEIQWFLSDRGLVVSYDGSNWQSYNVDDGLMDAPTGIFITREGGLWASGSHDSTAATAYFDKGKWIRQIHPYLSWGINHNVHFQASDSALWLAASGDAFGNKGQRSGVIRFNGESWTHFPYSQTQWWPYGIGQTADGAIWVGGFHGLQKYNGQDWEYVEEPLALKSPIEVVHSTPKGDLWVGTRSYGVFHYAASAGSQAGEPIWRHYTKADGLPNSRISSITQKADGSILVSSSYGMSRFDGQTWHELALFSDLLMRGIKLPSQESIEAIWINMLDGVWENRARPGSPWKWDNENTSLRTIRYLPNTDPPETHITLSLNQVAQSGTATITWEGIDRWNDTSIKELKYSWRLNETNWSAFTEKTYITLSSLPSGKHRLMVKARDHDFNEDPSPATMYFTVIPPVWQQHWFIGMICAFMGIAGVLIYRIVIRTRERNQARDSLLQEAEKELQTAHDMQMRLMPVDRPQIGQLDVSGRCIPANHVGGDFFQYFDLGGKLILAMADVTGHAMDAAVSVMMFSGVLDSQMELGGSVEDLFQRLNRSMHRNLDSRTFVCFTMGEIDLDSRTLRISNGGCPYPYHYDASSNEIVELQLDAYPLGVRAETVYDVIEIQLHTDDYIIFCSDGIAEAENEAGQQFGYEATEETIRQAGIDGLSAEATIDRILEAVASFSGDAPQGDDITCVVVKVEETNEGV